MTKLFYTIILSFLSTFLFGQDKEVRNLIYKAYQQIVPSNFQYYNLVDSSFVTEFDKYSFEKDELNQLLKDNPDFPINFFLQNGNKSSVLNWNDYHLNKAKVYSFSSIPKFES